MKPNVEFPKKVKSSFIFFQIGLIATMLVVLFALEFNFKFKPSQTATIDLPVATIDLTVPTAFKVIPQSKPIVVTKPAVDKPVFKDIFKPTTKEVPREIETAVDPTPSETQNEIDPETEKPTSVVV
ncbi:hypothetical protein ACFSX9_09530 [Flavobacterium ardleyense]|uniref:Energy transducer TonB n=1 Tax=Flavobacterium ardleyense TaxID=2038737 RepID=A0ABW5Z8F4_9FLAO